MVKKILGTASTRIINAIIMVLVLFIATNNLGDEKYGQVTLIILAITINGLINQFVGGSGLVYFIPRKPLFLLLLPSYFWAFFSASAGAIVMSMLGKIPEGFTYHVLFLSFFQLLTSVNQNVLLGKERVGWFNMVSLVQFIVLLGVLAYNIFYLEQTQVLTYIEALYAAYLSAFLLSALLIFRKVKMVDLQDAGDVIADMLSYGWRVQLANMLQFFNYRLNFYILEAFFGAATLGVLSAGVQLSEGLWIVGKSVSMVQFSKTVNVKDPDYVRILAIHMVKLTAVLTAVILSIVLLLPVDLFVYLFGPEFSQVKLVILLMAPGIIVVPCSMILSSYFSGVGKPQINTIGSGFGLIATLAIGFAIIPSYGLEAAAITASSTYLLSNVYLMNRFLKLSGSKLHEFIPKKEDVIFIQKQIRELLQRS